jgi:hypothetical protein
MTVWKQQKLVEPVFCPVCNTEIDENGWCGCDTIGGD